jgi:hypothetical protein
MPTRRASGSDRSTLAPAAAVPPERRWPLSRRWTVVLVLLAVVFVVLRGVSLLATPAGDTAVYTERVVVVGVTDRATLTDTDRAVLGANLDNAQVAAMSVRSRYVGDCAAAGWSTLGAGRRTGVAGRCDPRVQDGRVADWPLRVAAAAERRGDARLGTLAGSVPGCVAAVGPGAALAAVRPDGSLARYTTASAFLAGGARTTCPITLMDAGPDSDAVITQLAGQRDVTLFVTGIGPPPGSSDPALQVVYRIGTTLPGWLTSASTRRTGVVTLADLTRTLIGFGLQGQSDGEGVAAAVPIDGAPLQVEDATLSLAGIDDHLRAVAALSDAAPYGYASLAIGGSVLFVLLVVGLVRRRWAVPRVILALGSTLTATMMLPGAFDWPGSSSPGLVVSLLVAGWASLLTGAALLLSRFLAVPVAVVGAALTTAAFTVDAALGGVMEPGSLINSQPVYGLRWYGFGNVTFAAYAAAALVLAGWLAGRFLAGGHRVAAVVAVAVTGFGVVVCEGWPTMGTDFGGVIALTPGVVWMLLVLSGVRVTWRQLVAIAVAAVLAISLISWLDWRRGVGRRSHLGNFVQRILDGDAGDVVSRKAVAAVQTIVSPVGIGALVVGIALWMVIFRYLLPVLVTGFPALPTVAVAALVTAVLGTLLNDGGIYVWLTVTAAFTVTVASLAVDRARAGGSLRRDVAGLPPGTAAGRKT